MRYERNVLKLCLFECSVLPVSQMIIIKIEINNNLNSSLFFALGNSMSCMEMGLKHLTSQKLALYQPARGMNLFITF